MKIRILGTEQVFDVDSFNVIDENGDVRTYDIDDVEIAEDCSELLKYKQGDILSCKCDDNERWVFVYDQTDWENVYTKSCIAYDKDSLSISWVNHKGGALMTTSEIEDLRRANAIEESLIRQECKEYFDNVE